MLTTFPAVLCHSAHPGNPQGERGRSPQAQARGPWLTFGFEFKRNFFVWINRSNDTYRSYSTVSWSKKKLEMSLYLHTMLFIFLGPVAEPPCHEVCRVAPFVTVCFSSGTQGLSCTVQPSVLVCNDAPACQVVTLPSWWQWARWRQGRVFVFFNFVKLAKRELHTWVGTK